MVSDQNSCAGSVPSLLQEQTPSSSLSIMCVWEVLEAVSVLDMLASIALPGLRCVTHPDVVD